MRAIECLENDMNTPITIGDIHAYRRHLTIETGRAIDTIPILIASGSDYFSIDIGDTGESNIKDYFVTSLSSLGTLAMEKKNRRYVEYISEFTNNWNLKKPRFNTFTKDFVWNNFKTALDQLLQLKPDSLSFNLTNDCSIFFSAQVKESNIYFELFFDEETEGFVEAITNIYKDGIVVLAYGSTMDETFGKIQELFPKDKITESTSIPYAAISGASFATAEL